MKENSILQISISKSELSVLTNVRYLFPTEINAKNRLVTKKDTIENLVKQKRLLKSFDERFDNIDTLLKVVTDLSSGVITKQFRAKILSSKANVKSQSLTGKFRFLSKILPADILKDIYASLDIKAADTSMQTVIS